MNAKRLIKWRRVLTWGLIVGALLAAANWILSPPLKISMNGESAVIDVQSLGEYNSALTELTIRDVSTGEILWEVVPESGKYVGLWKIRINRGANASDFGIRYKGDDLVIVIPSDGRQVVFSPGHKYEVVARGENWLGMKLSFASKAGFSF
jgi:hypothetical protein